MIISPVIHTAPCNWWFLKHFTPTAVVPIVHKWWDVSSCTTPPVVKLTPTFARLCAHSAQELVHKRSAQASIAVSNKVSNSQALRDVMLKYPHECACTQKKRFRLWRTEYERTLSSRLNKAYWSHYTKQNTSPGSVVTLFEKTTLNAASKK